MGKKMISFEISDELREKLRVEAFKRSMSISALIRVLLEDAFQETMDVNSNENK